MNITIHNPTIHIHTGPGAIERALLSALIDARPTPNPHADEAESAAEHALDQASAASEEQAEASASCTITAMELPPALAALLGSVLEQVSSKHEGEQ